MERKTILRIHFLATIVAVMTILSFFSISLYAEILGEKTLIKTVKEFILFALPIMIISMPSLAISGNKLAGKSKNSLIIQKSRRMKFIMFNGFVLVFLAIYLYYRSHYREIDNTFFLLQLTEFAFGLINLTLIGLNARNGMQLSGKLKKLK